MVLFQIGGKPVSYTHLDVYKRQVMNNGLNLMGVSSYWQDVAKGVIIILAIYMDIIRNKKKVK